jgi:hypothetical protein
LGVGGGLSAPQRKQALVGNGGIGLGGIVVIVGIIVMIIGSFWLGLIILLIGLIAFGGFARGKWY